jgi:uncharacterized membrane protein
MTTNREEKQEIAELIREVDPAFWSRLNKGERDKLLKVVPQLLTVSYKRHSVFSGPIPSPEMLAEYGRIIPDGPERILRMAEAQSEHRRALETSVVTSQNRQSEKGQLYAFILALVFAGVGVWMASIGQFAIAGGIFTVTIGGLVTTFVMGRSAQKKDLSRKSQNNP